MAPLGLVGTLGWFSSTEVGIISLVAFVVLSVALLALCAQCQRSTNNMYEVSGTTTNGGSGANGTKTGGTADAGTGDQTTWRHHKNMPDSTLERSMASN